MDERSLASSARSRQRNHLAGAHRHRDVLEHGGAAVANRDAADCVISAACSAPRAWQNGKAMKTRGNPSGPGAITTPHLQRPDIRMQPVSCHHAQDPFAQGLGPYMEIPDQRAL